jgi:hypothetical protein
MKPKIKCNTFCKCIFYAHVMKLPKLAPCNLLSPHNAFGTKLVPRQAMNSHIVHHFSSSWWYILYLLASATSKWQFFLLLPNASCKIANLWVPPLWGTKLCCNSNWKKSSKKVLALKKNFPTTHQAPELEFIWPKFVT